MAQKPSTTRRILYRVAVVVAMCGLCLLMLVGLNHRTSEPTPVGREFQVNALTDRIQQSSSVALAASGELVVAWQSEVAGRGDEIRAQRFDAHGVAQGQEIAVNTLTASSQTSPAVALAANGAFVVVWQSLIASNLEVRAQRFDAHGVAQGQEIAVTARTGDAHSAPRVAMASDGSFVVVWESAIQGSYEIRARRYAADGVALGGEIPINTVTASSQRAPAIAMAQAGDFVVVWRSNIAGRYETRARSFGPDGSAHSAELAVHAATLGDQFAPTVGMAADGKFVVAWESGRDDQYEIRARRFTRAGVAQGAVFSVQPATAGDQFAPAVAMDPAGDFVVAWHSRPHGDYEIRARAFAADGTAQGPEIAVNSVRSGTQKAAAVGRDAAGSFVVAWHSDATGDWEIAARRFHTSRGLDVRQLFRSSVGSSGSSLSATHSARNSH